MSKEFVWTLDVDGEEKIWKCVVHENECVTYEGDVECKHLKITNPTKKQGVLQIDTVTKIYEDVVPFQLENGIPYIKLEDKWTMSETSREDRLQAQIKQYKKQSLFMCILGVVFFAYWVVMYLVEGNWGEWPIAPVLGAFCLCSAGMTMFRLKTEVEALGRKFTWKL